MRVLILPILLCVLCVTAFHVYADDTGKSVLSSQSDDTLKKNDETASPVRRPPDHIFNLAYGIAPHCETIVRASARDRIIPSDALPVYNAFGFEKRTFSGDNAPDRPLYRISDTIAARNDDLLFTGMVSANSDRPFHDSGIIDVILVAGKTVLRTEHHSLSFNLYYQRRSNLPIRYNIPIPFVSYTYKGADITASIGIPTMVKWDISPRWIFSASYLPVQNIESSLTFRPVPFAAISIEGEWKVTGYTLSDRSRERDRLFHEYLAGRMKITMNFSRNAGISVSAGYLCRERFFTGKRSTRRHDIRSRPQSPLFEAGVLAVF